MKKERRVAIFTRVSTERQEHQRQFDDLEQICKRNEYEITARFKETISGATPTHFRPILREAILGAEKNEYDIFMVTELSRLGRTSREVLNAVHQIHEANVCVYIQQFDLYTLNRDGTNNLFASFFLQMLGAFAELERETLIDRIKSGMKKAKAEGKHLGRFKGTHESPEYFMKKHKDVADRLKRGQSYLDIIKLTGKSNGTVAKVSRLLKQTDE